VVLDMRRLWLNLGGLALFTLTHQFPPSQGGHLSRELLISSTTSILRPVLS